MREKDIGINTEDREIQLDYISIKKKLNKAMKEKKLTQSQLKEITGIPQGRISTCLNEEKSDFFTFEQVYKICSILGLSMDELTGLNKDQLLNRKSDYLTTAKMIAENIKNTSFGMKIGKIKTSEIYYDPRYDESFIGMDGEMFDHDGMIEKESEYPAIYFSLYDPLSKKSSPNLWGMSDFLDKLSKYTEWFSNERIEKSDYEALIDSALSVLSRNLI